MRNLTVPADVAALIGAQRAADLTAGPYPADYRCVRCHRRGRVDVGEPLSAGADVGPRHVRVWFIHDACGPAGLVHVDQDVNVDDSDADGVLYGGYGADGIAWACVVVEIGMSMEPLDGPPDGERLDHILATALARGMRPAADPLTPPEPDGPICWRVQLPGRGRGGGVYGQDRLQLLAPLPPVPPGWLDLAADRGGQVGLYLASRVGVLAALERGDLAVTLHRAARAGQLVGATAAVVPAW